MLNGGDFRGWQSSRFSQSIDNSLKQPARANLELSLAPQASGEITVKASARTVKAEDRKNADVYTAVYENIRNAMSAPVKTMAACWNTIMSCANGLAFISWMKKMGPGNVTSRLNRNGKTALPESPPLCKTAATAMCYRH